MALRDLIPNFSKVKSGEELIEFPEEPETIEKINVRIENLTNISDVDRLMKLLKEGNILFLKTKEIQKKDIGQFQLAIQKLKRNCTNYGWDIVGTQEGYLVMTPRFAQIVR